jgi:hypothetical protein
LCTVHLIIKHYAESVAPILHLFLPKLMHLMPLLAGHSDVCFGLALILGPPLTQWLIFCVSWGLAHTFIFSLFVLFSSFEADSLVARCSAEMKCWIKPLSSALVTNVSALTEDMALRCCVQLARCCSTDLDARVIELLASSSDDALRTASMEHAGTTHTLTVSTEAVARLLVELFTERDGVACTSEQAKAILFFFLRHLWCRFEEGRQQQELAGQQVATGDEEATRREIVAKALCGVAAKVDRLGGCLFMADMLRQYLDADCPLLATLLSATTGLMAGEQRRKVTVLPCLKFLE